MPLLEQVWGHVQGRGGWGEGHSWVMAGNENCSRGWGTWENTTVGLRDQGKVTGQGTVHLWMSWTLYKAFLPAALPALIMDKVQHILTTRFDPKIRSTPNKVKLCFVANSLRAH